MGAGVTAVEKGAATGASTGAGDVPALEARSLTLSWDGQTTVVDRISLTVAAGEVVCLVGRSGCGKTTILHALSGLTRPLSGQVRTSPARPAT